MFSVVKKIGGETMTNKTFEVPNIHCMGCVQAIKNELRELDGVVAVKGDAGKQTIDVEYEAPATWGCHRRRAD